MVARHDRIGAHRLGHSGHFLALGPGLTLLAPDAAQVIVLAQTLKELHDIDGDPRLIRPYFEQLKASGTKQVVVSVVQDELAAGQAVEVRAFFTVPPERMPPLIWV